MTTPKLLMPELSVGQAGKELTHNQALAILDQLAQAVVVDKDLAAPPVSPANGSMYIVAAGATGAWAGQSGKLAYWLTTVAAWTFITPADGWSVWVTDEAVRYERKSGAWVVVATGGGAAQGINRLINGAFQVNQRAVTGTVTLAAGAYGHDRWKAGASGCTYTFVTTANVTTITITAGSLQQVIEGLNLQSGTHTLSWSGTAQGRIGAGSYGASGISGSAVGGANLTIEFNTGTISFAQLEAGSISNAFEHRPYGLELALCQRYFQVLPGNFTLSGTATALNWSIRLPVPMRTLPTISHKYTDASFVFSGIPPVGQWGVQQSNVAAASKSGGTITIALLSSDNSTIVFSMYGMTFSITPNFLVSGDSSFNPTASAEL